MLQVFGLIRILLRYRFKELLEAFIVLNWLYNNIEEFYLLTRT